MNALKERLAEVEQILILARSLEPLTFGARLSIRSFEKERERILREIEKAETETCQPLA